MHPFPIPSVLILCCTVLAGSYGGERAAELPIEFAITVDGAGASFPAPLYERWAAVWKSRCGMTVRYDSIGSGGGQKRIKEKTVIFGASDAPMSAEELNKHGLLQFPMVTGAVLPVVNLPGFEPGDLVLNGDVLGKIFLKKIVLWNDASIRELQTPAVRNRLTETPIRVVVREDSSGTTWVFTNYLQKASETWRATGFGASKLPSWQPDLRGPQNDGVAGLVSRTPGAIGYVEYTYARQFKLGWTKLVNRSGKVVEPTPEAFTAAADVAEWAQAPENCEIDLINLNGAGTWPLVAPTYILMHQKQTDWNAAAATLSFFHDCFTRGADAAIALDYIPLPKTGYQMVETRVWTRMKAGSRTVWPVQ